MRSTFVLLSFAGLALAKPYNSFATNYEDTAQIGNFLRHHHRRTHRPRPTAEQSITTAAEVKEITGNSEIVTLVAGNGVSDGNDFIVVTSKPDSAAHRTPGNKVTQGLPEQSSDSPILIHGEGVIDNSESHITQQNLRRHHHRRRTAHPLPTGKASTAADAEEATGNADNVTPAAEIVVTHDAAILLTGEPDSKAHRTLGGRFTHKPSTSEPDARAHRTGWVGRLTRRPSTAEPGAKAHRTRAAVTLASVITAEWGNHATDDSAWFNGHVTIAA